MAAEPITLDMIFNDKRITLDATRKAMLKALILDKYQEIANDEGYVSDTFISWVEGL